MKIAPSLLFDLNYIEPALVTAHELLRFKHLYPYVYLIYLSDGGSLDDDARALIGQFTQAFQDDGFRFIAIEVKNTLPSISRYHFSNSIIYKAIIPSMIADESPMLNLDAGGILGAGFEKFFHGLAAQVADFPHDWILASHCVKPADYLPENLRKLPHNLLYPGGNLFLFNPANYHDSAWHARILDCYRQHFQDLRYAELDLICLTAKNGELVALPMPEAASNRFLGERSRMFETNMELRTQVDNLAYFKFVGSFKPWKYWVLDPNKAVYTKRRALLETTFPLSGRPIIEKFRLESIRPEWPLAFLKEYDRHLVDTSA